MPRRNNRQRFEPLDLTTEDPEREPRRIGDQWTPFSEKARRERAERDAARKRRQERARLNGGIDWSVCLVPGCGNHLLATARPELRDHETRLPLCGVHLAVAYTQSNPKSVDPLLAEAVSRVLERREARTQSLEEARKKAWLTKTDGHIYYVRLNGMIKVGWTRTLEDRIRAYGPSVEVLVTYPATRDDETNLHRQLKPARARGHEWYEDGAILADFIAKALDQWGPPRKFDTWSKPKQIVAGKRVNRSA